MTTKNTEKIARTPGPWRAGATSSYHQRHYIEVIADVPLRGDRNDVTMEMPVCEVGVNEADARLIAAAPELLEALIECRDLLCALNTSDKVTRLAYLSASAIPKAIKRGYKVLEKVGAL